MKRTCNQKTNYLFAFLYIENTIQNIQVYGFPFNEIGVISRIVAINGPETSSKRGICCHEKVTNK